MNKKRILFCGEASYLSTGFSVYAHELLKRLYATGKYEIAELGSYAFSGDSRISSIPWKFYPVIPNQHDRKAIEEYESDNKNQFGKLKLDEALLDFRPDILIDIRDMWMCSAEMDHPYRNMYKILWMPTVDGEPQRQEWLDYYRRADGILTYSKYGYRLLEQGGCKNMFGIASPGTDLENMSPVPNKSIHKKMMGLDPNMIIFGTVMRNQKRKLYPDLMDAFKEYLLLCKKHKKQDIHDKSFLYLHTSYPDVGFDIPSLIIQKNLQHKVLVTYLCHNCNKIHSSLCRGERTTCPYCKQNAAFMPTANKGCTRKDLGKVINLFDAYVQYSCSEGWGMPICEAKACGVPVFATDYSAMSEQVHEDGGYPIRVQRYYYESVMETEQRRALPDNSDLAKKLYNFVQLPADKKQKISQEARQIILDKYTWEKVSETWQKAIDGMKIYDRNTTWDLPVRRQMVVPRLNIDAIPADELVRIVYENIISRPDMVGGYGAAQIINMLNGGTFIGDRGTMMKMSKQKWIETIASYIGHFNRLEELRTKTIVQSSGTMIEIV